MKILGKLLLLFVIFLIHVSVFSQQDTVSLKTKVLTGFNGGMMLHTGYLYGTIPEIGYKAKGAPFGLGGTIRLQLGQHWMIGGEGYVSTLRQMHNGSYIKYGWGGVLGEFYWAFRHVMPYVGLTVGGGRQTTFLMFDGTSSDWRAEDDAVFHKQGFFALTPFIGCDFIAAKFLHLTLKADWMTTISGRKLLAPTGPRFYFGVIFYH